MSKRAFEKRNIGQATRLIIRAKPSIVFIKAPMVRPMDVVIIPQAKDIITISMF